MSGLVATADLCALFEPLVNGGRLDENTVVEPGSWRGKDWPCNGEQVMRNGAGEPMGLVECTCRCHAGQLTHLLPRRANRTTVHAPDVLADG